MHTLSNIWDSIASSSYDSSALTANANGSLIQILKQLDSERFILYLDNALTTLPDINGFQFWKQDDYTLEVEVPKAMGLSHLFDELSRNRIAVSSMRNKSNRLEELFLKLTTDK